MKIGYVRVSTTEQNESRQLEAMKDLHVDRVFMEKISGVITDRPELRKMMDFCRAGDTIVVESYSRLARSTKDLLDLIDEMNKKDVAFVSLKECIDTSSPQGRLMMVIFSGLSQFERECIRQRQAEGVRLAVEEDHARKAQGLEPLRYKGRKPIAIDESRFDEVCQRWQAGEMTARAAMARLGLKSNTFYRVARKRGYMQ